jgi:hypothetical protein
MGTMMFLKAIFALYFAAIALTAPKSDIDLTTLVRPA